MLSIDQLADIAADVALQGHAGGYSRETYAATFKVAVAAREAVAAARQPIRSEEDEAAELVAAIAAFGPSAPSASGAGDPDDADGLAAQIAAFAPAVVRRA